MCLNQLNKPSADDEENKNYINQLLKNLQEKETQLVEEIERTSELESKIEDLCNNQDKSDLERSQLNLQQQLLTERVDYLQNQHIDLTSKLKAEKEKMNLLKKQITEFTLDNEIKSNLILSLEKQIQSLQKVNTALNKDIENLELQLNKENKTWSEVSLRTQDLENRWQALQTILEKMKSQEEKLLSENKNLNKQILKLKKENMVYEMEIKDLDGNFNLNSHSDVSNDGSKENKRNSINCLTADYKLLQQQFSDLETELTLEIKKNHDINSNCDKEKDLKSQFQIELAQLTVDYQAIQSKESHYLEQITDLQNLNKEAQNDNTKLKTTIRMDELHIEELTNKLEPLQYISTLDKAQIKDQQNELEIKQKCILELREEKIRLTNKLEKTKIKLNSEQTKASALQEKLNESNNKISGISQVSEFGDSLPSLVNKNTESESHLEPGVPNQFVLKQYENDITQLKTQIEDEKRAKEVIQSKLMEIKNKKLRPIDKVNKNLATEVRRKDRELKKLQQGLLLEKKKSSELEIQYQKEVAFLTAQLSQEHQAKLQLKGDFEKLQSKIEAKNELSPVLSPSIKKKFFIEGLLFLRTRHNIRRREGWKRQFVKATNQRLLFYNSELDKTNNHINFMVEAKKLFHVRAVTQGDVIRAGPEDIQRIFQVLYVQEDSNKIAEKPTEVENKVLKHRGHDLIPITLSTCTTCDLCNSPLTEALKSSHDFECRRCRMKVHKIHIEQSDEAITTCKVTYDNSCAKELLLLAKNSQEQQLWITKLSQVIQKLKTSENQSEEILSPPIRSQTRTHYKP